MGYHPRIESKELGSFLTTRSRNSELWFVNNPKLEEAILGYAAKFRERYGVKLYGLAIEGNHIQAVAQFPNANRASFMRDLNGCVARAVARYTPEYPGGRFFGRRYSSEILPGYEDIEDRFFYTALQPVQDGLVERLSQYREYNFFHDAVYGIERKFKVVNWAAYNMAKRWNTKVSIVDYTTVVSLKYSRLPGYEEMPRAQYIKLMYEKLEARRQEIVAVRYRQGLGFAGPEQLKKTKRGSKPHHTKTSDLKSHRPRVLSICPVRRAEYLEWYFSIYYAYKEASKRYRSGELNVPFPPGTYKPYVTVGADP